MKFTDKDFIEKLAKLLSSGGRVTDKLVSEYEKEIIKAYKKALKSIQAEIGAMYAKYGDSVTYSEMMTYNRLSNLENQIATILKDLTGQSIKTITESIKQVFAESYYFTGFALETTAASKLGFGILNPNNIKASVLNPADRIQWPDRLKEHTQQLNRQVQQEVTQGLIQGKGYSKIAQGIKDKIEISTYKAVRIARTEGHRVQTAGKLSGFNRIESAAQNLNLKVKRVWVATLDFSTRDTHRTMDGKEADAQGKFHLPSGVTTYGPGLSGVPEEDINCRCSIRVEIEGLEQKFRKDNISKELISFTTYEQWFNNRIN